MTTHKNLPISTIIGRGLLEKCPNCGKGKLFTSYLRPVQKCSVCGEHYGHIRADDGPAWLTILITGHVVVAAVLVAQRRLAWPMWLDMVFWLSLTTVMALAILPRAKGFFIAMIWHTKAGATKHTK